MGKGLHSKLKKAKTGLKKKSKNTWKTFVEDGNVGIKNICMGCKQSLPNAKKKTLFTHRCTT